jgi:NADH-quinone oxidoreductase subunit K
MLLISFVALSAVLFCVGLFAVLTKRNPILRIFALELMMGAVSLNIVSFARFGPSPNVDGQIVTLFFMMLMLAHAVVGVVVWFMMDQKHS